MENLITQKCNWEIRGPSKKYQLKFTPTKVFISEILNKEKKT